MAKKKITKKMSFAELMQENPDAEEILSSRGMHCAGCPMAMYESVEQGAMAHGLDPEKIVKDLNKGGKKTKKKNGRKL